MTNHKKKSRQGASLWLVGLGLVCLTLVLWLLLRGNDVALLNPKGHIANEQFNLIVFSVAIMMIVAIPTIFLFYFFAWKYRETDHASTHVAEDNHGRLFTAALWAIPIAVVAVIVFFMWSATHRLEPKKTIASDKKPLTIQVIAMRWKWVFLYPEQNIATVNFVQAPVGTPIQFDLTADEAPMNSFWIPHWGGQLYAMTGHKNRLNLLADTVGDYPGSAAEINGRGFAGMRFTARASTQAEFDAWVAEVRASQNTLEAAEYEELLKPSENESAAHYATYDHDLYDKVLMKYNGHSDAHSHSDGEAGH